MSLINQYLEKTGEKLERNREFAADVPPVLKSGRSGRSVAGTTYKAVGVLMLAGIALSGAYLYRLPTTIAENNRHSTAEPATATIAAVAQEQQVPRVASPDVAEATAGAGAVNEAAARASAPAVDVGPVSAPTTAQSEPAAEIEPVLVARLPASVPPAQHYESYPPRSYTVQPPPEPRRYREEEIPPAYRDERFAEPPPGRYRRYYEEAPAPAAAPPPRPQPEVTVRSAGTENVGTPAERAVGYYQLALAAQHEGQTRRAEQFYRQVLSLEDNHLDALNNLAVLQMDGGRVEEAEKLLVRLLSVEPNHVSALNNLGLLNLRRSRPEQAGRYFGRALEVDPASRVALLNQAWLARERGDFAAGNDYFERLIAFRLYDRDILLTYAAFLERQENVDRALAIYHKALPLAEDAQERILVRRIRERIQLLSAYLEDDQPQNTQ